MNSYAIENRRHFVEDVVFPIQQLADNEIIRWDEFVSLLNRAFLTLNDVDTRGISPKFLIDLLFDVFDSLDPLFVEGDGHVELSCGGSRYSVDCVADKERETTDSDHGFRLLVDVRWND